MGQLVWFLFWLGTTAFAFYLTADPKGHGTHQQLGLPPCPSAFVMNRPCPGCGLTTSFTATVHGQFIEAFRAHQLGPILYLLFTASALACGYGFLRKLKFNSEGRRLNRAIGWLVAIFILYGGVRFLLVADYNGKRTAAQQASVERALNVGG